MTRLNIVDVEDLTDRHLVAEYKELTQFLHIVIKRVTEKHPMDDLPEDYTLNGGHCKFFFNKGRYLYHRFVELANEMETRGMNVDRDKFQVRLNRIADAYPIMLFGEYTPNVADYSIAIDRISQRINEKPHLYPDKEKYFNSLQKYVDH